MLMPALRLWDGYHNSYGPFVEKLQWALHVSTDGRFGRCTLCAVLRYQEEHELEQDGIVGPKTWASIQGLKMPKYGLADSPEATPVAELDRQIFDHFNTKYLRVAGVAAHSHSVDLPIIYGIGVRESQWGLALKKDLTGDCTPRRHNEVRGPMPPDGMCYGRGLLQIDWDWHEFARIGDWAISHQNIAYGVMLLARLIAKFRHCDVSDRAKLRMAIASYNCGSGNVKRALRNGYGIDHYTAHRDYSKEVLRYAGIYEHLSSNTE